MFDRYLTPFAAIPHLVFCAVLAIVISAIAALPGKRTRHERTYHAVWFFTCSIASVIAGSWLMFLIHG